MACLNTDLIKRLGSKETYSRVYSYFRTHFPTKEVKIDEKQSNIMDQDKYTEGSKKDPKIEMYAQDFMVSMFNSLNNAPKKINNFENYLGRSLKFHKIKVINTIKEDKKNNEELKLDPKYTWERNPFGAETKASVKLEYNPDYSRCPSIRKAIDKVVNKLKGGTNSKEYLIGKYLLKYEFSPKEIASKLNLKPSWTYEIISGIKEKLRKVLREDVYENNINGERI